MELAKIMQRVFGTTIAAFASLCFACVSAFAAGQPQLKVGVDRAKIYEGESIRYVVTLENVQNPVAPNLKALDADFSVAFLGESGLNSSHMTVVVNGKVVTNEDHFGRQYNYQLTPRRTGTIVIPAPSVTVNGQTLQGQAVTVVVQPPDAQDTVRLELRANRTAVYPMQPFTVTLAIFVKSMPAPYSARDPLTVQTNLPLLQIGWAIDPQLPKELKPAVDWRRWLGGMENHEGHGFAINNIARETVFSLFNQQPRIGFLPTPQKVQMADRSGRQVDYWRYEFSRTFTANRIEHYAFGPASLKGEFATEVKDGRILGEDIFASAKPITVEVQDVPTAGRPDCYINAVGKFHLSAALEPRRAKTGDPMTLTVSLEGEGTLDSATAPDLKKVPAIADHFKVYDATETTKGNCRTFTYSVRPTDAALHEFPAIAAAYFDVDAGKYATLQTEPIAIDVTKAVQLNDREIVASSGASNGPTKEVEANRDGIYANVTDLAQLGDASVRPDRWLIGGGGLLGAYIALVLIVGRWRRVHGDTALLRRRAALGTAKGRLSESSREFAAGRTPQAAEAILDALLGFVADTLNLTFAGLTVTEACRQLESLDVDAELVARVRTLLETCEGVRYGASEKVTAAAPHDAGVLLRDLAAALKRKAKNGIRRPIAAAVGLLLLSCVFSGGCIRSPDSGLVQKFQAAQQAFDNAKKPEDFARAAALDQEILDRFGPSGAVYYNQGNAWMQAGQPGRAVAAYRQAQRYSPRIAFLNENLAQAVGDASSLRQPILETILFWQNWFSCAEKFYWTAAAAILLFTLAVARLFVTNPWLRRATWACALVALVLGFSAGYDWHRFDAVQHGVVIQSQAIARKGNAASYGPAFKEPLREATEFALLEHRGDWLLIRLPGGGEGWIEEKAAVTY
jgi:hypothetical protein